MAKKQYQQPLTVPPSALIEGNSNAPTMTHAEKISAARAAMAASSLAVKNPVPASSLPQLNSTVLALPIDEIDPYEKNPRVSRNEMFEDIKESIRATKGLDGIIQVMRQPGKSNYVCAKGANTRVLALKQLWEETQDQDFQQVLAQIVSWKGHAAAIADHVKENTLRGDMTYWDRAKACLAIWDEAKAEGVEFSGIKAFAKALREDFGYPIDVPTLSRYLHCARHFEPIGARLNAPIARELTPLSNALVRLALKWGQTEEQAWQDLELALRTYADGLQEGGQAFDMWDCGDHLRRSAAVALGLTEYQLDFALAALKADPADKTTKEDLLTTREPMARIEPAINQDVSGGDDFDVSTFEAGAEPEGHESGGEPNGGEEPDIDVSDDIHAPESPALKPTALKTTPLDFDTAMERVIDAAAAFADLCDVGEHLVTGRNLPYGFFIDIKLADRGDDDECAYSLYADDGPKLPLAVRQGAFWLLLMLSKQWDMRVCNLLPNSRWRRFWTTQFDDINAQSVEANGEEFLQAFANGAATADRKVLMPVHLTVLVFEDANRARSYADLAGAVDALNRARNLRTD